MPRTNRAVGVEALGPRQKKVLDYILSTVEDRGYPPSVREIADAVGLASPSTVHAHLEALQKKGYIRKDATKPRAIEISYAPGVGPASSRAGVRHVPLVGRIAAGSPTHALETIEDVLPLPAAIVGDGEFFMLRVTGESMIDAGIHDGDYVVIRKQSDATPGSIVAALLDDEATVKTLVRQGGRTILKAENPAFAPIEVTEENSRILGKVVALLRSL
ncbi:MAG: transcriptional repressor LexA [Actinomycetota bacterium]